MWWKRRGWFLLGVITLALGIGATTALFSVVRAVLLTPLPVPHPAQVLSLSEATRSASGLPVSYPDYLDWQAQTHSFSALAALRGTDMALTHLGVPAFVPGLRVSGKYFSLLGVAPRLGRAITPADNAANAPAVVVLSSQFFAQKLGSNPTWLGRTLDLDGVARTVIGVMPPGLPVPAQFWTPLGPFMARSPALNQRGARAAAVGVIARLRPGTSLTQARADLSAVAARLAQRYPATNHGVTAQAEPLLRSLVGDTRPVLWGLLVAVSLLLLLACANVANLLLARALRQQPEDALRSALGASPGQLMRRRLGESLALGGTGAAAGFGLALLLLHAAPALLSSLPRTQHFSLDLSVVGFAAVLAVVTALLCGLAPALAAAHARPAAVLASAREGAGSGHRRLRSVLVGGQLALALLLLAGAGLLLRSLAREQAVQPGFNPRGVESFVIGLPAPQYPTRARQLVFFRAAQQRLAHVPGVTAAGGAFPLPFAFGGIPQPVAIPGQPTPPPGQTPTADVAHIEGNYFGAMGMHLLRGRAFQDSDDTTSAPVAIVDSALVARYWPKLPLAEAIGRPIEISGIRRSIVGVVNHVRESALTGPAAVPEAYVPLSQAQFLPGVLAFVLRTDMADPAALGAAAAAQIQAVDANQPITQVATLASLVAATLAPSQIVLALLAAFALLALLLAAVGVYSALSYAVAQRRREIGVRMALGAQRGILLGAVLAQGMKPAWIGAAVGLGLVLGFGHLAAAFLPEASAHDPLTLALAVIVLLAVAAVACLIPARRAASVDPLEALREP